MKKEELLSQITSLSSKACDLRCELEEARDKAEQEWVYADDEDLENMFREWENIFEDLAEKASTVENVLFKVSNKEVRIDEFDEIRVDLV